MSEMKLKKIRYRGVCVSSPNVVSYIAPRFIVSAAATTG